MSVNEGAGGRPPDIVDGPNSPGTDDGDDGVGADNRGEGSSEAGASTPGVWGGASGSVTEIPKKGPR